MDEILATPQVIVTMKGLKIVDAVGFKQALPQSLRVKDVLCRFWLAQEQAGRMHLVKARTFYIIDNVTMELTASNVDFLMEQLDHLVNIWFPEDWVMLVLGLLKSEVHEMRIFGVNDVHLAEGVNSLLSYKIEDSTTGAQYQVLPVDRNGHFVLQV